jgi:hypothetical protein
VTLKHIHYPAIPAAPCARLVTTLLLTLCASRVRKIHIQSSLLRQAAYRALPDLLLMVLDPQAALHVHRVGIAPVKSTLKLYLTGELLFKNRYFV